MFSVEDDAVMAIEFSLCIHVFASLWCAQMHITFHTRGVTKTKVHTYTPRPILFYPCECENVYNKCEYVHSTANHTTLLHILRSARNILWCEWNVLHLCVLFIHSIHSQFFAGISSIDRVDWIPHWWWYKSDDTRKLCCICARDHSSAG